MKLIEYLEKKYPHRAFGLTRAEAKLVGIPYPLQTGWVQKFGATDVNEEQMFEAARKRRERIEQRKAKRREGHGAIQQ